MRHNDRTILLVNVRQNAVSLRTEDSNIEMVELSSSVNIKRCIFRDYLTPQLSKRTKQAVILSDNYWLYCCVIVAHLTDNPHERYLSHKIRILCQASGGVQYSLHYSAICEFRFDKQQTSFLLLPLPRKRISITDVQMKYSCLNVQAESCQSF
jgi:hypothetical protein